MHRSPMISTENLYEIKAPLATFDTIDLGDDELLFKQPHLLSTPPSKQRTINELEETSGNDSKPRETPETKAIELDTPTTDLKVADSVSPAEDGGKETKNTPEASETNSSGNNAGIDDVDFSLRKVKDNKLFKKSNVKYEQIDNGSDASDQEPSPRASLKLPIEVGHVKGYDSDSDSSDSDSGYIRSGYISATKGVIADARKKKHTGLFYTERKNNSESETTPTCSPKVSRQIVPPPPLSKEDSALRSKRRAYEKRLQRLQVTTTPILRPRSTTPINIIGLEEYASISSPEKSPQSGSLEKLKIKLPQEDFGRGKSPRRGSKTDARDHHVFDFDEDLLFTHTKSAILIEEDGHLGQSPKRVLVPPTLSPALSPANSPRHRVPRESAKISPRFIYSPEGQTTARQLESSPVEHATVAASVGENWATFDEPVIDNTKVKEDLSSGQTSVVGTETVAVTLDTTDSGVRSGAGHSLKQQLEEGLEEVLTVQIEETGAGTAKCDIQCSAPSRNGFESREELNSVSESSSEVSLPVMSQSEITAPSEDVSEHSSIAELELEANNPSVKLCDVGSNMVLM